MSEIDDLKTAIVAAKHRAKTLVDHFRGRARSKNPSSADREWAKAAEKLYELYEMKSGLMEKGYADELLADLTDWRDEAEQKVHAVIALEKEKGKSDFSIGPVREAVQHAIAATEVKDRQIKRILLQHSLDAWNKAVAELLEFDGAPPQH